MCHFKLKLEKFSRMNGGKQQNPQCLNRCTRKSGAWLPSTFPRTDDWDILEQYKKDYETSNEFMSPTLSVRLPKCCPWHAISFVRIFFYRISMPGLEVCLNCVLLFICLCIIKKKGCSCVKCVQIKNITNKQKKPVLLAKVWLSESMSVATTVASVGFNTYREPKVWWCMFIWWNALSLFRNNKYHDIMIYMQKNSFTLCSSRCLNEQNSAFLHWI